jgi:hypothetical protein
MASMLMSKDLNEAAEIFAYKDAKTSIKENPYKVLEVKHAQSMQQIHTRGSYSTRAASIRAQGMKDAAKIKAEGEMETLKTSEGLKRGYLKPQPVIDPRTGRQVIDPKTGVPVIAIVANDNDFQKENVFETTDQLNIGEQVRKDQDRLSGVFKTTNVQIAEWLKQAMNAKAISNDEVNEILNSDPSYDPEIGKSVLTVEAYAKRNKPKVTMDNLGNLTTSQIHELEKGENPFQGQGPLKTEFLAKNRNYYKGLTERFGEYIKDNANVPFVRDTYSDVQSWLKPAEFAAYENHDFEDWKLKTKEAILAEDPGAKLLFDANNNLISPEEIKQITSKAVYGEYQNVGSKQGFWESALNTLGHYTLGRELDPETMKYWKSWTDAPDQAPSSWLEEKYVKYAPYVRGIAGLPTSSADVKDQAYLMLKDKLNTSYQKAFSNMSDSQWLIQKNLGNIPGSSAIGEGGTGVAANRSVIQVLPLAPGTKGFSAWHGTIADIRNIGNFDGKQNAILFGSAGVPGSSKTALESDDAVTQTEKGRALLDALISASLNPEGDLKPFTLKAQNIAAGDPNKGAMIIMPDQKWLEAYKSGKEGEDNLLTADEYNSILQNGLTVVSDLSNFNNTAMTSTYKTALENIVDYRGSYEEYVPGAGTFKIEKGQPGTSDYITTTQYKVWSPQDNAFLERVVYDSFLPKTRAVEQYRQDAINNLYDIDRYNTEAFNGTSDLNY